MISKRHAVASLSRAQHRLKHRFISVKLPLSPRSYSEYTVPLSFGTPPQTLHFTVDTGVGNTTGLLLNETLGLGKSVVDNFTVGCSVSSADSQEGIVGFGRAPESLPSQMGLKSFSHCMVSHDFDDNPNATGDLVLTTRSSRDGKFNYTPFLTNPRDYSGYYYVGLQSISVGPVSIKVPVKYLEPDATGYGGTIIDSGTSFTLMPKPVFNLVFKEFQRQVGNKYKRDKSSENKTGLELCYRIPTGGGVAAGINLPQLTFTLKGRVEMVLPLSNYFSDAQTSNARFFA